MAIRTVADIDEAHRSGQVGLVFGLEAATPIENEIDRLDVLYGLGLRQIGIAYSDANALGSGLAEATDGGLTAFGRRAVTRMNQLGLAIDVSHSSDRTALDVCEQSDRPVFMTHAGARAVWDTPRMKPDDVLRAVAGTGGVIGMSAAPHTTLSAAHPRHSIESVMDHFRYCVDLVGIEHVAFGPDTLYGDHVQLHRIFADLLGIGRATRGPDFEPVAYVDGLENPDRELRQHLRLAGPARVRRRRDPRRPRRERLPGAAVDLDRLAADARPAADSVPRGGVEGKGVLDKGCRGEQREIGVPRGGELQPDREPAGIRAAREHQRRRPGEVEHGGEQSLARARGRVHRRGGGRRGDRGGRGEQHVRRRGTPPPRRAAARRGAGRRPGRRP